MSLCIIPSILYKEDDIYAITLSALITLLSGLIIRITVWKLDIKDITNREAYLIVTLGWIMIAIFGSLPYLLSGTIKDITGALFESTSGLTTTGATVLRNVEALPHGILLWRSLSQWIGGMGFVMLTIALIPMLATGGLKIMASDILDLTAEQPSKTFLKSIRNLWFAYFIITIIIAIAYKLGGMNIFDAICHAFTTISTGGFSTHNNNIAFFNPKLQYIIIICMLISGANFPLIVKALTGKPLHLFKSQELRYYILLIIFISGIIAASLIIFLNENIEVAIRTSLFQVISFISTTGYIVTDYTLWLPPLWFILFLLILTGSCSGSSGGGLKVMRQLIMIKSTLNYIKNAINPHAVYIVKIDNKIINEDIIHNTLAYYFIYLMIFVVGSFFISLIGMDFKTSIGVAASAIGNIGPGIGYAGPYPFYDTFPVIGKLLVIGLMLIGRLEFFSILILFSSSFWKK